MKLSYESGKHSCVLSNYTHSYVFCVTRRGLVARGMQLSVAGEATITVTEIEHQLVSALVDSGCVLVGGGCECMRCAIKG